MSEVVLAVTDDCGNVVHFEVNENLRVRPYDDVDGWVAVYGDVADSSPDTAWEAEEPDADGWYGRAVTVVVE